MALAANNRNTLGQPILEEFAYMHTSWHGSWFEGSLTKEAAIMASELHSSVTPSGKPKLLDQVRHGVRVRHIALSTERLYVN